MGRLNWGVIASNVAEAREELERIEASIESGKRPREVELRLMFEHAYHHLNFAWNARRSPAKRHRDLAAADFNLWGKFPPDIEEMRLDEED